MSKHFIILLAVFSSACLVNCLQDASSEQVYKKLEAMGRADQNSAAVFSEVLVRMDEKEPKEDQQSKACSCDKTKEEKPQEVVEPEKTVIKPAANYREITIRLPVESESRLEVINDASVPELKEDESEPIVEDEEPIEEVMAPPKPKKEAKKKEMESNKKMKTDKKRSKRDTKRGESKKGEKRGSKDKSKGQKQQKKSKNNKK